MFKSRTLALAGTVGILSLVAAPIAAAATAHQTPAKTSRTDVSRDAAGARHVDRSIDKSRADPSVDLRNG